MNRMEADLIARRTISRYQKAIDAMSAQRLAEVFADDAVLYRGGKPVEGVEAILAFYQAFFPVVGHMRHYMTSTLAEPQGELVRADTEFSYIHVRSLEVLLGWGEYIHVIKPTADFDGVITEKHIKVHHVESVQLAVADALRPRH